MCIHTWLRRWLQEIGPPTQQSTSEAVFETAVAHYEAELKALEASDSAPANLLSLLLRRDQVAVSIVAGGTSPQSIQRLVDLDCRLREVAPRTLKANWDAWRQILTRPLIVGGGSWIGTKLHTVGK